MRNTANETKQINVAIYVRTSMDAPDSRTASVTVQETACRAALDHRFGCDQYRAVVYREYATSMCNPDGTWREQYPALARMQAAFEEGVHQVISLWDLSRISRRADLADFLNEYFRPHGLTAVISCNESCEMRPSAHTV